MLVLIWGGGDLASGVGVRLCRSGFEVVITELPESLVVRRKVSFAEAVHEGLVQIEGVTGKLVEDFSEIKSVLFSGNIPVLIDPDLKCLEVINPDVVLAPFDGILRGLLRGGSPVTSGLKLGDVDPRGELNLCKLILDKSRTIGGGVLEAILACPDLRSVLWT